MTRARARAMQQKVNSLLSTLDLGTYLDGMLFTSDTLCVIRYLPHESRPDENKPGQGEEKRPQPRPEEGGVPGTVLPPDTSGTTAPRPSGTTARPQAVLPLTPEAPQEAEKSSGKST